MRFPELFACLTAVFLLSSCTPQAQQSGTAPVTLSAEDSGQTVTLVVGQSLILTLPGNPSTGFQWEVAQMPTFLEQTGEPVYRPDGPLGQRPGAGGASVWHWKAIAPGSGALRLVYQRSWEKGLPPAKTAAYEILVRQQ